MNKKVRMYKAIILLLSVVLVFTGCPTNTPLVEDVAATGVSLDKTTASVDVDASVQLTATVAPSNATTKTLSWVSDAPTKATVSNTGLVTGVAAGTANITGTTTDGSFTATCIVTVNALTTKTLTVDIANDIFEDRNQVETGSSRELGADKLIVNINGTEAGSLLYSAIDSSSAAHGYTQLSLSYTGSLSSVEFVTEGASTFIYSDVDGTSSAGYDSGEQVYTDTIDSINMFSDIQGYSSFSDVEKIKLYSYISSPYYLEDISDVYISAGVAPIEMLSPDVYNSDSSLFTDRTLSSGEVGIEISWAENPANMTYDLYYFTATEDLSDLYDYSSDVSDKWTSAWDYTEITSTGKSIGGTTYTMTKLGTYDALDPLNDGKESMLMTGLTPGEYIYVTIISHFGNGYVESSVDSGVQIK